MLLNTIQLPTMNTLDVSKLNSEQFIVYTEILNWLDNSVSNVALLEGKPGVGKTFLLKYVIDSYKKRTVFTAPTNKATKVLKEMLTSDGYVPDCCTIYSLLGLSMSNDGEVKEVVADDEKFDVSRYSLIVLDECYMVNAALKKYIDKTLSNNPQVKLLLLGDSYQIPPVGESKSTIEDFFKTGSNPRWKLHKVERHAGDILTVVDQVRDAIDRPLKFKLPFLDSFINTFEKDVCVVTQEKMIDLIEKQIENNGNFEDSKIIGWMNKTIDFMNIKVRSKLYPDQYQDNFWCVGDQITLTAPAKDYDEGKTIATTDEMGIIEDIDYISHPSVSGFDSARLRVLLSDNSIVILYPIAPYDRVRWTNMLASAFKEAKSRAMTWKNYWELHDQSHYVRHAYAITAHRAQGSTYNTVYVNLNDILRNQNRVESLQCLFVAMSRAKSKLIIGR